MKQKRPNYHSYLLRMWRTSERENTQWYFMLVNPHTGERHSFVSLSEMVAFLQQMLAQ